MSSSPRVSVVIPTYNRAQPLLRALESVYRQTYRDYEILVIDDGSTDDTQEMLAAHRDRVRVLTQENQGVSAARNRGVAAALGEFVAFLDSDDEWLPEKLARQVAYLDTHPDVAFLACLGEGQAPIPRERYADPDQQFLQFLVAPFPQNMTRYIVRKGCLERYGSFDRSLHGPEDWEFWLRLLKNGCRFDYLNEPLIRYYDSPDAISRRPQKMLEGELKIKQRYVDTLDSCWQRCWIGSKFLARSYFCAALSYRELGDLNRSRGYLVRSLWTNPCWPHTGRRLACLLQSFLRPRKPHQPAAPTAPLVKERVPLHTGN